MSDESKPTKPGSPLRPLTPAALWFSAVTTIAVDGSEPIKVVGMVAVIVIGTGFVLIEMWKNPR